MVIKKSDVLVLNKDARLVHPSSHGVTMRCGQHTRLDNSAFKSDVQASQSTGSSFFETTITREPEVSLDAEKGHRTSKVNSFGEESYGNSELITSFSRGGPAMASPGFKFNFTAKEQARKQIEYESALNGLGVAIIA